MQTLNAECTILSYCYGYFVSTEQQIVKGHSSVHSTQGKTQSPPMQQTIGDLHCLAPKHWTLNACDLNSTGTTTCERKQQIVKRSQQHAQYTGQLDCPDCDTCFPVYTVNLANTCSECTKHDATRIKHAVMPRLS